MKLRNRLMAWLLCAVMICALLPAPVQAKTAADGQCGENLTWTLTEDGVLTISGTGDMGIGGEMTDWFEFSDAVKHIIIEEGVTSVSDSAFRHHVNLQTLSLPDSLTRIGRGAFTGCTSLEEIVIPDQVTDIGTMAFSDCTGLKKMRMGDSVRSVGSYAFENCTGLTDATLSASLKAIPVSMFQNSGLTHIELPEGLETIGLTAFSNCKLESITIPKSVSEISGSAFSGNSQLKTIYFLGSRPEGMYAIFPGVTATAYYPADDASWSESDRSAMGGDIIWVAVEPAEPDVTFVGASLSLKGDIGLNYYAALSQRILSDSTAYMNFTGSGADRQVAISEGVYDSSDDSYRYSVALNAKNMGDDVTAQVYNAGGAVGEGKTLSIKYYADYVINNSAKEVFVNLMKAMLNYGAAAQTNFGYDVENLVNADMSEADRSLPETLDVAKYAHTWSGEEAGIEVTSASLLLQSETKIRIYFKLAEGKTLEDFTFTIDGVEVTPVQSGEEYYIEKTNVAAKDLDTMYTFRLGNRQLTYCGLSYVNQVLNYSKDEKLLNLVKSLYCYNQAANAYFQPNEELPHTHSYESVVTEPACEADGYTTYTCACDNSYKGDETAALGHKWGDWVRTKEPTTSAEGEDTRTCTRSGCGKTETRAVEKLPEETEPPADDCTSHSWGNWTSDSKGSYGNCTNCGQSITIDGSTSNYAQEVINIINEYRAAEKLDPVTWFASNGMLVRAHELTVCFSHNRPDGSHGVGTCIAAGYSSARAVVDGWMGSSNHRGSLMNPNATEASAAYNGSYWVLYIGS